MQVEATPGHIPPEAEGFNEGFRRLYVHGIAGFRSCHLHKRRRQDGLDASEILQGEQCGVKVGCKNEDNT